MGLYRVWLFALLGMAYLLSCVMLVYMYESYFRSLVIGNEPSSSSSSLVVVVQPDRKNRRTSTTTTGKSEKKTTTKHANTPSLPLSSSSSNGNNDMSSRVHTCTLSNGTTLALPMAPDVILAGAMKSGTSYFWNLLRMHPAFIPSKKFEAHFFDWQFAVPPRDLDTPTFWQRFDDDTNTQRQHQICAARHKYIQENFDISKLMSSTTSSSNQSQQQQQRRLTYEKTPNYMFLPQIPRLIMTICPWQPKIILILRNPVDRAYSHYVMDSDKDSVNL